MSDQAQALLDRPGTFRAYPLSWKPEPSDKADSKSVAIAIQYGIFQQWHPDGAGGGQWGPEWQQGFYVYGRTYVIGREGKPNAGAIEAMAKAKLWDGDWDKLGSPPPRVFVIIDVETNEYGGKTTYRAAWVNPNADVPTPRTGGFAPPDEDLLQSLRARFGGATRAIAGGGAIPSGAPSAPPAPPAPPGAARAPQPQPPGATAPPPAAAAQPPGPPVQSAPPQHQAGAPGSGVPPQEGVPRAPQPPQPPAPPGVPPQRFGDAAEDPGKPPF